MNISLTRTIVLPLSVLTALAAVPAIGLVTASIPPGSGLVAADDFTGTAGPLAPGQIEVAALSTRAATVTGGDVLIGVRGVGAGDTVTVAVEGRDVTAAFAVEDDPFTGATKRAVGLVTNLRGGLNDITATVVGPSGTREATLPVMNHPLTGPVFSGPHQALFTCRVSDLKDFAPGSNPHITPTVLDGDCSFETYVRWYYLSEEPPSSLPFNPSSPAFPDEVPYNTHNWVELTDPYGAYPDDMSTTVTTEGDVVPAIARLETTAINRGITRIAILDDPAARGPDAPFETPDVWNDRVIYNWGASCGIGRQQGINTPNEALSGGVDAGGEALDVGPEIFRPAVLQGYMTAHSSMTIFNTHCNQVLSAETFMMVREYMTERYGRADWVMGNGASGGAIQQYTTMNMYPGLLDGGVPLVSFPDVVTTAMSPVDCRLLRQVFQLEDGVNPKPGDEREIWTGESWDIVKQNAITGHASPGICEDWDDSFADLVVADKDCSRIPNEMRYSRATGVGERCTLQDNLALYLGRDEHGFGRRPVDNTGVQYGYQALLDDIISVDEFLYLNRNVGGMDVDGYGPWDAGALVKQNPDDGIVQPRMAMDDDLVEDLYAYGFVGGRGAIAEAPIIDINLYVDPAPILGFHDQVRSYMTARRVEETFGERETMSIWSGAVLTNDAWPVMHEWLDDLEAARAAAGGMTADRSWTDEVASARPLQGGDNCVVTTAGYSPVPLAAPISGNEDMPCEQVFRPLGSTRIAAGGPGTEDIIKCQLAAPKRSLYAGVTFSDAQWAELGRIFEGGVCDWSRPGVGEVGRSQTWQSWGNDMVGAQDPTPITNLVARS